LESHMEGVSQLWPAPRSASQYRKCPFSHSVLEMVRRRGGSAHGNSAAYAAHGHCLLGRPLCSLCPAHVGFLLSARPASSVASISLEAFPTFRQDWSGHGPLWGPALWRRWTRLACSGHGSARREKTCLLLSTCL
jgi:hypothetical protein